MKNMLIGKLESTETETLQFQQTLKMFINFGISHHKEDARGKLSRANITNTKWHLRPTASSGGEVAPKRAYIDQE